MVEIVVRCAIIGGYVDDPVDRLASDWKP